MLQTLNQDLLLEEIKYHLSIKIPKVQNELDRLVNVMKEPDKNKIRLLEEADEALERLNEILIESRIDFNSKKLSLGNLRITRFPKRLFNNPTNQNYWQTLEILDLKDYGCRFQNRLRELPDLANLPALQQLLVPDEFKGEIEQKTAFASDVQANKNPKDEPIEPTPSLIAKLTSFSAFPRLSSLFFTIIVGAALLLTSVSWTTLIAGAITGGAFLYTFLKIRNDFYNKQIKQNPPIAELAPAKQEAFLAGKKAANSMTLYFGSFLRKNNWKHYGAFGAGMQTELNRRLNRATL